MSEANTTKAMSKSDIEAIVKSAITDAVAFVESEIAPDRLKAQKYYDGEVELSHEEGRSKVVSTKVRDKIRAAKPSLMRVFLSTSRPVEFKPTGQDDVALAEQQTDAIQHEFNRLGGFKVLNDVFHDALLKKQGIGKAYWVEKPSAEIHTYTDLTDDEYTLLVTDEAVTVLEHSAQEVEFGIIHDCKIQREKIKGELCIESVPPEEFFVDENARTMDDAYVVIHKTDMRVGDVVQMGFDIEELIELASGSGRDKKEVEQRQGYLGADDNESVLDDSMKKLTVSEVYMRIDVDNTGVPVLHKIICIGEHYKLLDIEPWDEVPFAKFEVDPEPHSFYGTSLAEVILNDQDTTTSVLRGILDNVAMVNNPRLAAVEGQANAEDLLNNEIGAVVRVKSPTSVTPLVVPFVAGQTLTALTYLDGEVESKTGITRASSGLAPDTLQASTRVEAAATVQGAAGQVEVMVRNLADGVADFFGIISRIMVKNFDEEKAERMAGQSIPVDPRAWNTSFDMQINVGLGTGREGEKSVGLNQALQMQTMIYQTYGPQNGLVSLVNIRNTLSDLMAVSGIRNADRYFAPITAEQEQQMLQAQAQQAQQSPQGADPNAAFVQVEQTKAMARAQADAQRLEFDKSKALADDDLKRDEMAQKLLVEAAKVAGQYGQKVDVARVNAEQDKVRVISGIAQGAQQ